MSSNLSETLWGKHASSLEDDALLARALLEVLPDPLPAAEDDLQ